MPTGQETSLIKNQPKKQNTVALSPLRLSILLLLMLSKKLSGLEDCFMTLTTLKSTVKDY